MSVYVCLMPSFSFSFSLSFFFSFPFSSTLPHFLPLSSYKCIQPSCLFKYLTTPPQFPALSISPMILASQLSFTARLLHYVVALYAACTVSTHVLSIGKLYFQLYLNHFHYEHTRYNMTLMEM